MLRLVTTRALSRRIQHRTLTHFPVAYWHPSKVARHMNWIDRELDAALHSPLWAAPFSRPIVSNDLLADIPNPIVEEDGVKKFKLQLDFSGFKPEEIRVQTATPDNTLMVEAKHVDDTCKYEFSRTISLQEGTNLSELKCRFSSDGTLTLEAPFNTAPIKKNELPQNTDIPVHNLKE